MKPELDQSQLQSALLDNFPHPLMLIGKDRKVIASNPAARELGADVGEFCWGSFGQCHFIPDADRDYFAEHEEAPPKGTHCSFCKADDCLATQAPQNDPAVKAFGRIFDTYWTPLDGDRFLHYAIDVTEKKQAEETLHGRDVRFRALFDGMSNGVAVYNAVDDGADFVILDLNRAGQEMDNTPLEKAVGRKVTEVFPGVEAFGLLDVFRRVWRTGVPEEHPLSEYKENQISFWRKNSVYKLPSGEVVSIYSDETAAKQAEAQLAASERKFRSLYESIAGGVMIIGDDYIIQEVNAATCKMTGFTHDELVGQQCDILCPKGAASKECPIWEKNTECFVGMETSIKCRDGQNIPVLKNAQTLILDGKLVIFENFENLTAIKQAEAVILAENARFAAVMDSLDADVYAADMQTHEIIFANRRAKEGRGELIGKKCWKVLQDEQTGPCAFCTNDQLLDADGNPTGPYLWETKNTHDERWYQRRDEAILWPDGRIVRLEIAFDITERKEAEEALRQYEHIVASTTDHLAFVNTDYVYQSVNHAYLTAHRKTRDEIIGYTIAELLGEKTFTEIVKAPFDRCLAGESQNYQEWFEFDGTGRHYMDVAYHPFRDSDGSISGVVVSSRDITTLRKAEEVAKQRGQYLEGLNNAAQTLLAPVDAVPFQSFVDQLGPASNASRVYVFMNHHSSNGELLTSQVAEWCAEGVHPEIENPTLQNLSYDDWLPRWHDSLHGGDLIAGCVADFPENERAILEPQGIQAILIIPIFVEGEFVGFIGFDNCVSERVWDDVEKPFLQAAANDLTQAIRRKRAEILLKRTSGIVQRSSTVAFLWRNEENWPVEYVSENVERLMGYTAEDFTSGRIAYSAVVHPDDLKRVGDEVAKRSSDPACLQFEHKQYRIITKDGAIRWVEDQTNIRRDENNQVTHYEGLVIDITERKLAEVELRQYEHIVASTSSNLSFVDTNYVYQAVNEAYLTVHGKTRSEIIGHTVADLLGEDVFEQKVKASFDRCLAGETQNYQAWFDFKEIGRRYMDVSYFPYRDEEDSISGIVVSSRDITALHETQAELVDQKQRLDYILQGTNVGTWEWNVQTGETRFNARWAEIIGYTLEELSPISIETWMKFAHPDDLPESNRLLQECFSGKTKHYHFETRMRHKNGTWVWVLDRGKVTTRTQDGKPEWMYGTHQDITERKHTEGQVRESLKEKEVLLREIHHRVKNNLQVIVSLLRMHARQSDNEQVQRVFGDCQNRVNAMSLIHEALYRSEDLARIDTEPYLEKLCRNLRQAHGASDKGIALTVGNNDLPLGMDQGVAVGMIVCELVSNTFKHAFPEEKPGSVRVSLSSVGEDDVELIVQDDGVGLPPDVDISNTPSLGLHLVSITATHELGGTIDVERNGGTRFIIRFKRKDL